MEEPKHEREKRKRKNASSRKRARSDGILTDAVSSSASSCRKPKQHGCPAVGLWSRRLRGQRAQPPPQFPRSLLQSSPPRVATTHGSPPPTRRISAALPASWRLASWIPPTGFASGFPASWRRRTRSVPSAVSPPSLSPFPWQSRSVPVSIYAEILKNPKFVSQII